MTVGWQVATVTGARAEARTGRTLDLEVPGWPGNLAGQHLDLRLTAPDGYTATRSYSIASSGPGTRIQLAVDRLPDGEVSPYLVEEVVVGDQLEVRGPLGGWFVWRRDDPGPVQLIGGGSGIVPLMAMARAHSSDGVAVPFRLLYSVRTPEDAFFADELKGLERPGVFDLTWVYTRAAPAGSQVPPGRVSRSILESATIPASESPTVFVCGPTGFVETVADILTALGHLADRVKTERFGGA